MLVTFDNRKIIKFNNINTPIGEFDDIHKVLLDGINENMATMVQKGKHGTINKTNPTTMG